MNTKAIGYLFLLFLATSAKSHAGAVCGPGYCDNGTAPWPYSCVHCEGKDESDVRVKTPEEIDQFAHDDHSVKNSLPVHPTN